MSDRLAQLEKLLEREPTDPFLLYGVAMEHKKAGRTADAIEFFDRTIAADAGYCYAFYQLGQTYEQMGDVARAKKAYEDGIAAARVKGDDHALSEIEGALSML
jgi:tetratricopeptide (TPR) repeat protein